VGGGGGGGLSTRGRLVPKLEPGTMRVHVTNVPRGGVNLKPLVTWVKLGLTLTDLPRVQG